MKPSRKHFRKAARQIALKQAFLTAAIVTTITAIGYFLALSKYALLLWAIEFFVVLAVSYPLALRQIKTDAADLLGETKTYESRTEGVGKPR